MSELLLGCGPRHGRHRRLSCGRGDDWTNLHTLDINPDHEPDTVWDLNKLPLPFADNQFDEVHGYQVFEHLGAQGDWPSFFAFFTEIWRILKPGGCLAGISPSPTSPWAWADPGHTRIITADTMTFLHQPAYLLQSERTDYRRWYKGDFDMVFSENTDAESRYILQAVKPARIGELMPSLSTHLTSVLANAQQADAFLPIKI